MNKKKVLALGLAAAVTVQTGMAECTVAAAETAGAKEEVVYVMTDADGGIDRVDVVNIFGKGAVTDYGSYSEVKMLNTTEDIHMEGDRITFSADDADKEKIYYQGTLTDAQIPWKISITYSLDGRSVTPEELAGQSGALQIYLKIEKNERCTLDFYDDYALQAAVTLDTELCKNIVADGATMANVGVDKQISYTVLPGKGLDATIRADVSDFEMDAIAINGVKLNLDVDLDDDELMDQVTQITDAAKSLNDGAEKVSDGTGQLLDGSSSLSDGASALNDGVDELAQGLVSLQDGVTAIQKASTKLNGQSKNLTDGSAAVKKGISDVYDGSIELKHSLSYTSYQEMFKEKGLNLEQLQAGNTQAAQLIATQIGELNASLERLTGAPGYEENEEARAQAAQLQAQINSLRSVATLLQGNNAVISGTKQYFNAAGKGAAKLSKGLKELKTSYDTMDSGISSYTDGVGQLTEAYAQIVTGTDTLTDGSRTLADGSADLRQGAGDLYDGVRELSDGTGELHDGTQEFYEKTDGLDTKVEDSIDSMIGSLTSDDSDTQSFVSAKNKNVASVQFVIKTAAIEKTEKAERVQTQTEKLSFWEKLLNLFRR